MVAAAVASILGLVAAFPGIEWGLPSEDRLHHLLPEAEQRAAVLRLLSEPVVATETAPFAKTPGTASPAVTPAKTPPGDDGDPVAACTGPIDPASPTPEGLWMRAELVPLLLGSDDPDEMETFGSAAKVFGRGAALDERAFLYGHVYLAAVAGSEAVAYAAGLLPRLPTRADLLGDPALLRRLYVLGRCVSVLAAALAAGTVAYLLHREGAGALGIAAAVAAALAPMTMAAAHVAKPHAFAALFGLLAVALLWRAANRMSPAAWALAALPLAIAASASPPYAVLGLAAPAALVCAGRRPATAWTGCALAFVLTGAAAVILLNPLALAHPDLLAAHARHHLAGSGWGYGRFEAGKLSHFVAHLAGRDLGLAALPLVAAGLYAGVRRTAPFATYVALVAAVVVVLFGGFVGVPRIAVIVAPLGALLAGLGASALAGPAGAPRRTSGAAIVALCVLGLAVDVAASAQSFRRAEPADQAAGWIRDHVDAGACLTIRADRPLATYVPRFDLLRYRLRRMPLDAPLPAPGPDAETIVLSAASPETDPTSAWIAPRGPYHVVARFPDGPLAEPGILLRGPRPQRAVLILSAAPGAARASGG